MPVIEEPKRPRTDYDALAHSYRAYRSIHPVVLQSLSQSVNDLQIPRILEMGCGTGNYISALESETRGRCWGHDPSEEMIRQAERRTDRVVFAIRSAEDPCFTGNFFDLIYTVDVLHHIEERRRHFKVVLRLLKQGSAFCIVTDSEEIIRTRNPLATFFPETIDMDLKRYPSIKSVENDLREEGFSHVRTETVESEYTLSDAGPFREKAFSVLDLIPDKAFKKGMKKLQNALKNGPVPCVSRYQLIWARKPEE